MIVGEVAPLILEPVIVPLAMLAALIVAFGIVYMVEQLVRALFGTASGAVAWIPWLGSKVTGTLHSIEQRVTNALGAAEHGIDRRMGRYLTALGQSISWVVNEIRAHSSLMWTLATLTLGAATTDALRHAIAAVTRAAKVATARIHTITHAVHVVTVGSLPALRHWTVSHVRALEHAVVDVFPRDIASLRRRAREAEQAEARLWRYLRSHPWTVVTGAFIGAVAVALGRLGVGWVRCNNVGRVGRSVCGFDPLYLESLLLDALVIAGSISIVELARECQAITGITESAVRGFVREL